MQTVVEARLSQLFRLLAAAFAVTGALFFVFPNGTISVMNAAGGIFGFETLAPAEVPHRFWLSLGTAYMGTVTVLAYLISHAPLQRRPMMLALAAGKATSSLTCLIFVVVFDPYFIYFANFLVDGSLVAIVMAAYFIAGREFSGGGPVMSGRGSGQPGVADASPGKSSVALGSSQRRRLGRILEAMVPLDGPQSSDAKALIEQLQGYFRGLGPSGLSGLRWLTVILNFAPMLMFHSFRTLGRLDVEARSELLDRIERARWSALRLPLHGFKLIVMLHYYGSSAMEQKIGMNTGYLADKLAYAQKRRGGYDRPILPIASGEHPPAWAN